MADASHLDKMGRELKCPICLSLFNSAISLTCNHVFCNSCIQKSMKSDSSCPVCKVPCTRREVRPAPHMDNLVHIYKSMEIASGVNIFVTQNASPSKVPDEEREAKGGSGARNTKRGKASSERAVNKGKLSKKASKSKLKSPGTKPIKRSFRTNKRVQVPKSPLPETPIHLAASKPEGEEMHCVPNSKVPNNYAPLNGNSNQLLGPLFWLREDEEKLTQSTDVDHLTLTPVNIPNFSDIKDSDDDTPGEVTPREEASSKRNVADLFDSEMFEWTQRACSPELCSTPIRIQLHCSDDGNFKVPSGENEGRLAKVSGTSSEGATGGIINTENCEKSPDKGCGSGKSHKRTRNGRIRSQSKRTKKSQGNDVAAGEVNEFVSDQGCGSESHLVEAEPLNQVDENVASKLPTSCIEQGHPKGVTLRIKKNSMISQDQRKAQAKSRLQKPDFPKLDAIKEVAHSPQQDCEGRMSELSKLSTQTLGEKESSIRVDHLSASSTDRKSRRCGQELKCKRKVDVSIDVGHKQSDVNADIHAESTEPTVSHCSLKAGNVVRKCQSRSICGFCHLAEETQLSGEMIKYFQGRPVSSDFVGESDIIHSHKSCAEWAPNVYFQDDIAINLEAELTRSRRIKCSLCGDKGAALGCYDKSCRRSFHVPCAKRLRESRWDTVNFVMLCPLHASSKLPNEQSGSQVKRKNNSKRQSLATIKHGTDTNLWDSRGCLDKLNLCCSALTAGEKEAVTEFKRLSGASVSKNWNTSITHVIASTDENVACKRTLKVLMGILEGKWILSIEWIKACLNARKVVDETTYEVSVDTHGIKGGPQLGRLRLENKQPKVFSRLQFYLAGDFEPSYKGYLHDLITSAGGTILHRKPIKDDQGNLPRQNSLPSTIVVYSVELPNKNDINKDVILKGRQVEAEALAKITGSKAASNLWVLNCISGYNLQPLHGSMI